MDISADTVREYRRNRALGIPAMYAKPSTEAVPAWLADFDYANPASGTVDGFNVTAEVEIDDMTMLGDDSVTGTFTDRESETTVPYRGAERHSYKFYEPPECLPEPPAGASRSVAADFRREAIQQCMREDAERAYYGVSVTAYRDGIELGSASPWGIDVGSDDNGRYFREVAMEILSEAIADAQSSLERLCSHG